MRHPFVAAIPISVILLATAAVALAGPSPSARAAWWIGSLAQLVVTAWVLAKWWRGNQPGGIAWASLTPALIIPVVGNVLVPLAGVPLGHEDWSAAQFAVGVFFWPVVHALIAVRLATQGSWPERLQPAVFVFVAPPSVVGLALAQFGAHPLLAWGAWGIALFSLLAAARADAPHRRAALRDAALGNLVPARGLRRAHAADRDSRERHGGGRRRRPRRGLARDPRARDRDGEGPSRRHAARAGTGRRDPAAAPAQKPSARIPW